MSGYALAWEQQSVGNVLPFSEAVKNYFAFCWRNKVSVKSSVKKRDMGIALPSVSICGLFFQGL